MVSDPGDDIGLVLVIPTLAGVAISALGAFVLPFFFPISLVGAGISGGALATLFTQKEYWRRYRWKLCPLGVLAVGGLGLGLWWPCFFLAIWLS